jgi:hypothetical protein
MKLDFLSRFRHRFRQRRKLNSGFDGPDISDIETVQSMVRGIVSTRGDEIGCDECFEKVDRYAEMVLEGRDAAAVLPLVRDHLDRCNDCREEFEALLTVLRALAER